MSYPPPAMLPFIEPATPVLYPVPPRGADRLHEVEFDGWRVLLHKYGNFVQLYSRGGHKAARFSDLVAALASIPAQSCVIEGEVVACNNRGLPDFHALHLLREGREVCVWAFDLLHLDAKDARGLPLVECKALLARLVHRAADSRLRLSESFDDGAKLLAAVEKMGLEGVVSKRGDAPYRSAARSGWIKIKTLNWLLRSRDRSPRCRSAQDVGG